MELFMLLIQGFQNKKFFNPRLRMESLLVTPISKQVQSKDLEEQEEHEREFAIDFILKKPMKMN